MSGWGGTSSHQGAEALPRPVLHQRRLGYAPCQTFPTLPSAPQPLTAST